LPASRTTCSFGRTPPIRLQTGLAEQVQRIEALARNLGAAAAKAGAIATALSAEVFG
jgi:type I restriction enzyme, S subunit